MPHRTTPHHATPPRIVSKDGGTSSLVSPPGLATIVLPDYSTSTIALLLAFLTTGSVVTPVDQLQELGQLAAVLELKMNYSGWQQVWCKSGGLVLIWWSGAGLVVWCRAGGLVQSWWSAACLVVRCRAGGLVQSWWSGVGLVVW